METITLIDRFNAWLRESVIVKLISIGFLVLLLLIPTAWITSIMEERQSRADSVIEEVSGRWSGSQTIAGPVLVVPYMKKEKIEFSQGEIQMRDVKEFAFFLPESLIIKGNLNPEVLHRGIFDVAVYQSTLSIDAVFPRPDFGSLEEKPDRILWNEAKIAAGISDLRGIVETPTLMLGGKDLVVEPTNDVRFRYDRRRNAGDDNSPWITAGVETLLGWATETDFKEQVSMKLSLKGSSIIRFLPLGKTTDLSLQGPWSSPSFEGEFLPTTRTITNEGFEATWKILHFNRPFAQAWSGKDVTLNRYDLATRLIVPADQYQKSIRTAKYGILLILLTFTALFLVEIVRKIRIHPFQYILIGAALIIYYSLLLSLSEHMGYNLAYLAATVATVALVSLYSSTFMAKQSLVFLFTGLISFFYGFIFVIIQAQDFSLLIGSLGLFFVVAALMYFSRSVNWYGDGVKV